MSTALETDTILVNRAGVDRRTTLNNMSTLQDTDLLLVNRAGIDYRCTAADVKAAVGGGGGPGGKLIFPASVDAATGGADLAQWRAAYAAKPDIGRMSRWLGVGETISVTFNQPVIGFLMTGGSSGKWAISLQNLDDPTNYFYLDHEGSGTARYYPNGYTATRLKIGNAASAYIGQITTLCGIAA
jgi:hypothetical protein